MPFVQCNGAAHAHDSKQLVLDNVLKSGWVSAEWALSARNRRVRVYRITAAGRKQLQHEISAFERMLSGISRVMKLSAS
jgi:DNA-binding PadR family transcriptional regulator